MEELKSFYDKVFAIEGDIFSKLVYLTSHNQESYTRATLLSCNLKAHSVLKIPKIIFEVADIVEASN